MPKGLSNAKLLELVLADSDDDEPQIDDILDDDNAHGDDIPDDDEGGPQEEDDVIDDAALVNVDEDSSSDDEEMLVVAPSLTAPSGTLWRTLDPEAPREPVCHRTPDENIFSVRPGVKPFVQPGSALRTFEIFMESIIEIAARFTNLEGRRFTAVYNRQHQLRRKVWSPCTLHEMRAFIGMHILAGAFKSNHRNTKELWSDRDGYPAFRATMSLERFFQIKRFFRCDDRSKRSTTDPLSPVRDVWNIFNDTLRQPYTPEPYLTIDEQLMEYHGRVKFRMYIATKPGKYGIKIIWLNEACTGYALHGCVYIGESTLNNAERRGMSVSEAVTLKVCKPFLNKGYNVTCDNWFTSYPLAQLLLNEKTTLLGTIRANRRDLPPMCKDLNGRTRKSCSFFSSNRCILASYWDKGTKPVLLLSTMHKQPVILNNLPEIVQSYNETKSGTDNMDHMVRFYTSRRKCRRWPYGFFFNMVDIALLNSYIIYSKINSAAKISHYSFLLDVGYAMLDGHIRESRTKNPSLTARAKQGLLSLGYTPVSTTAVAAGPRRGRCHICSRDKDFKTTQRCSRCSAFVCNAHSAKQCVCHNC